MARENDRISFGEKYSQSRAAGKKRFLWRGKLYSTEYAGTPQEQLEQTGITDDRIQGQNWLRNRVAENITPRGTGHLKSAVKSIILNRPEIPVSDTEISGLLPSRKEEEAALEEYYRSIKNPYISPYEPRSVLDSMMSEEGNINPFYESHFDALNLAMGKPQQHGTIAVSDYQPGDSNEDMLYYSLSNPMAKDAIFENNIRDIDLGRHVTPSSNEYISALGDYTVDYGNDDRGNYISYWDTNDYHPVGEYSEQTEKQKKRFSSSGFSKPFEFYDRIYYRDYPERGKQQMFYTDEELANLTPDNENFNVRKLQRELFNRGYDLSNSLFHNVQLMTYDLDDLGDDPIVKELGLDKLKFDKGEGTDNVTLNTAQLNNLTNKLRQKLKGKLVKQYYDQYSFHFKEIYPTAKQYADASLLVEKQQGSLSKEEYDRRHNEYKEAWKRMSHVQPLKEYISERSKKLDDWYPYHTSRVDETWGPETEAALRDYQKTKGTGAKFKLGGQLPMYNNGGYTDEPPVRQALPEVTVRSPYYYTENPNDPRFKAYSDSLYAYNAGLDLLKRNYDHAAKQLETMETAEDSARVARNKQHLVQSYQQGAPVQVVNSTGLVENSFLEKGTPFYEKFVPKNIPVEPSAIKYHPEYGSMVYYDRPKQKPILVPPNTADIFNPGKIVEPEDAEVEYNTAYDESGVPRNLGRIIGMDKIYYGTEHKNRLADGSYQTITRKDKDYFKDGLAHRVHWKDSKGKTHVTWVPVDSYDNLYNQMNEVGRVNKQGKVHPPPFDVTKWRNPVQRMLLEDYQTGGQLGEPPPFNPTSAPIQYQPQFIPQFTPEPTPEEKYYQEAAQLSASLPSRDRLDDPTSKEYKRQQAKNFAWDNVLTAGTLLSQGRFPTWEETQAVRYGQGLDRAAPLMNAASWGMIDAMTGKAASKVIPAIGRVAGNTGRKTVNETGLTKGLNLNDITQEQIDKDLFDMHIYRSRKPSFSMMDAQTQMMNYYNSVPAQKRFKDLYGDQWISKRDEFLENVGTATPTEYRVPKVLGESDYVGMYRPKDHLVQLTAPEGYPSAAINTIGLHEYTHAATRASKGLDDTMEGVIKDHIPNKQKLGDAYIKALGPNASVKEMTKTRNLVEYILDPTEVYARVHELRAAATGKTRNFTPATVHNSISKLRKKAKGERKDLEDFVNMIGAQDVAELMNKLPVVAPIGIGAGAAATQSLEKKKYGGYLMGDSTPMGRNSQLTPLPIYKNGGQTNEPPVEEGYVDRHGNRYDSWKDRVSSTTGIAPLVGDWFDKNIPAWQRYLPIASDVDDIINFADAYKRGNIGHMGLTAGAVMVPAIGGRLMRNAGKYVKDKFNKVFNKGDDFNKMLKEWSDPKTSPTRRAELEERIAQDYYGDEGMVSPEVKSTKAKETRRTTALDPKTGNVVSLQGQASALPPTGHGVRALPEIASRELPTLPPEQVGRTHYRGVTGEAGEFRPENVLEPPDHHQDIANFEGVVPNRYVSPYRETAQGYATPKTNPITWNIPNIMGRTDPEGTLVQYSTKRVPVTVAKSDARDYLNNKLGEGFDEFQGAAELRKMGIDAVYEDAYPKEVGFQILNTDLFDVTGAWKRFADIPDVIDKEKALDIIEVPFRKKGGMLPKHNLGGPLGSGDLVDPNTGMTAGQGIKDWFAAPESQNRLSNVLGEKRAARATANMNRGINTVSRTNMTPEGFPADATAQYDPYEHQIYNPSGDYLTDVEETFHAGGLASELYGDPKIQKQIRSFPSSADKKQLANPNYADEVYARMMKLRLGQGWQPGQTITPEMLPQDRSNELFNFYDDNTIIDMLNTVAMQPTQGGQDMYMARRGGKLPIYQNGGGLAGTANAMSIASGVVSDIPVIGPIASPVLGLIGSGLQAQVQQRENRQKRNMELQENATLNQANYGSFEYGGGLMGQNQGNPKNPAIVNYDGKSHTHEQGIGGIPVDSQGNPVARSGNAPVGLTEKGEIAWNGYVFSDTLKNEKGQTFADEAKAIMKKYELRLGKNI